MTHSDELVAVDGYARRFVFAGQPANLAEKDLFRAARVSFRWELLLIFRNEILSSGMVVQNALESSGLIQLVRQDLEPALGLVERFKDAALRQKEAVLNPKHFFSLETDLAAF